MLYSIDNLDHPIREMPHRREFEARRRRLGEEAFNAAWEAINQLIEGTEIQTSSWIPGADWRGTPFYPIYEACGRDERAAGLFFGQIVWHAFMHHDEDWSFGRYEKDGIPIRGLTYFRITRR